jgi:hypothetical protein
MEELTGKPVSQKDIDEALAVVQKFLEFGMTKFPPESRCSYTRTTDAALALNDLQQAHIKEVSALREQLAAAPQIAHPPEGTVIHRGNAELYQADMALADGDTASALRNLVKYLIKQDRAHEAKLRRLPGET